MPDLVENSKGIVKSANPGANGPNPSEGRRIFIGFGINDYDKDHFRPLNNAGPDVEAVSELLKDDYGFEIHCYTDAKNTTLQNINTKLISLIPDKDNKESNKELLITEKDSLVLYLSGHGIYSNKLDATYFAPSNGRNVENDYTSLLDADQLINKILPKIPCFHLLLIIDCCFAGGFAKEGKPISGSAQFGDDHSPSEPLSNTLFSKKSRCILTSGWREAVSDGEKGTHSPFAKALLTCLRDYYDVNFMSLVNLIRPMVIGQKGGGTVISDTFDPVNHQQGEFVFYKIKDGRPNPLKLKNALYDLNFKPQRNEIKTPALFNLCYLNGTENCGHHLFTHRFFLERKKRVDVFHAIPYTLRTGAQEGVRPIGNLWQLLARHFFQIEHEIQDRKNIVDRIVKKLEAENCVFILKVEKKSDDNKLESILADFWGELNKILSEGGYAEPGHRNNFFLFVLDRRGSDLCLKKSVLDDKNPTPSKLARATYFSTILPIDKTDDLEDWWDRYIQEEEMQVAKFQALSPFKAFEKEEYIANAIRKICDQCDRMECFDDIFLKAWIT